MRLDSTDNPALQQLERAYPEMAELLRRLKTLDAARVPTSKTVPLPLPSHWTRHAPGLDSFPGRSLRLECHDDEPLGPRHATLVASSHPALCPIPALVSCGPARHPPSVRLSR